MGVIENSWQISKIVALVVSLFNLNSFQENTLKNYVKMQQYEWIEKRKSEQEVEELIKIEARNISKE